MAKKTKKKAAKKPAKKAKKKAPAAKKAKKTKASKASAKKKVKKASKAKPKGIVQKIGKALGLAADKAVKKNAKKAKVAKTREKTIKKSTKSGLSEAADVAVDHVRMQYTLPNYESIEGRQVCHAQGESACGELTCEKLTRAGGFCRLHYIRNWKQIKRKELVLKEGKLNRYIEELVNKYPDRYMEAIREDLGNDSEFAKTIQDLEIDENVSEFDDESAEAVESLIGNIRRDSDEDDFD